MKKSAGKNGKATLVVTGPDGKKMEVNLRTVKNAQLTLRALNHPLRKAMLELIDGKGEIFVSEVYAKLSLEQSVASQHLAILRRAQIVNTRRDGKRIYYTVNGGRIKEVVALAAKLSQDPDDRG